MDAQASDIQSYSDTREDDRTSETHGLIPLKEAIRLLQDLMVSHALSFTDGKLGAALELIRFPRASFYRHYEGQPRFVDPGATGVTHLMATFVRRYLALAARMSVANSDFDQLANRLGLGERERQALRPLVEYY